MKHGLSVTKNVSLPLSFKSRSSEGSVSLTDLMRRRLVEVDETTHATWAERLVEMWIVEALKGNFRALQEILNRLDDDALLADQPTGDRLGVDEQTSARVLEALCEETDSFPSD